MLRALYDKTLEWSAHRHATWILALVAFTESSFFLIPPDVLLIPMVLAARTRWFRLALICTIASVFSCSASPSRSAAPPVWWSTCVQ